jgi:hypothetical protein
VPRARREKIMILSTKDKPFNINIQSNHPLTDYRLKRTGSLLMPHYYRVIILPAVPSAAGTRYRQQSAVPEAHDRTPQVPGSANASCSRKQRSRIWRAIGVRPWPTAPTARVPVALYLPICHRPLSLRLS